ncbi:MAG: DUF4279 domain-containing protein [Anaerolineales bacterium]
MSNRESITNNENTTRIYATFILRGKELDPQLVTNRLGITPSRSFKRGDKRTEEKEWLHGFWGLTSDERIHSTDLALHIEWVINQLEPVRDRLVELMKEENIDAEISCFWILPTSHEGLSLGSDLLERIAFLGLKLNLDIYCS